MGGKRAAPGAALLRAGAGALLVPPVVGGLVRGDGLLDILERQGELVRVELLGAAAELRTLQLAQEVPQPIHLRQRLVALGDRSVALGACRHNQRLQRLGVGWKLICDVAHDRHST